jgi:hypothetical protein
LNIESYKGPIRRSKIKQLQIPELAKVPPLKKKKYDNG